MPDLEHSVLNIFLRITSFLESALTELVYNKFTTNTKNKVWLVWLLFDRVLNLVFKLSISDGTS